MSKFDTIKKNFSALFKMEEQVKQTEFSLKGLLIDLGEIAGDIEQRRHRISLLKEGTRIREAELDVQALSFVYQRNIKVDIKALEDLRMIQLQGLKEYENLMKAQYGK